MSLFTSSQLIVVLVCATVRDRCRESQLSNSYIASFLPLPIRRTHVLLRRSLPY
ncbi:hypothetical protein [Fischerella sp. PCC 9605]|uniref:hypothetical protein n=1 Tax=Fischerella sp. PCC 9605 TaxID=1173024 RepID=UPI001E56971C|nr:hypothetical protein [Fischerella sp. PCC 9605]